MPACHTFHKAPGWAELFGRCAQPVSADWDGAPLPFSFSFFFAAGPDRFYFGAEAACAPCAKPGTAKGEFHERLWEHDVIELFLADDNTAAYQELNLSPNGAWWTMVFRDYREQEAAGARAGSAAVEIFSEIQPSSFRAGLSLPRAELGVANAFSPASRANLCAILGGKNDRCYISAHPAPGSKPDFHLARCFTPLNVVGP